MNPYLRTALKCGGAWFALLLVDSATVYFGYSVGPADLFQSPMLWWSLLFFILIWLLQLPFVLLAGFGMHWLREPKARALPWTGQTTLWILLGTFAIGGLLVTFIPLMGALGFMLMLVIGFFSGVLGLGLIIALAGLGIAELVRQRHADNAVDQ